MSDTCSHTKFVIPRPSIPSVAVKGIDARFPVRRIFCVGRNYAAHAREMGRDPNREPPFFFLKPSDTVLDSGVSVPYPPQTKNFHYEIELVVAIGVGGADIPVIAFNRQALGRLAAAQKQLVIVPRATHLFEEPGTLEEVARLAADWFLRHLTSHETAGLN